MEQGVQFMKLSRILALILALGMLFSLACLSACDSGSTTGAPANSEDNNTPGTNGENPGATDSNTDTTGTTPDDYVPYAGGDVWIKFFKAGRAGAILVRTENTTVLINTGDEEDEETRNGEAQPNGMADDAEKILEYLEEKSITKIDYLIVTEFNKNYIGGVPTLLNYVTVEHVIEPAYTRPVKDTYQRYQGALNAKNLTPQKISSQTSLDIDGALLRFYPTNKSTSSSLLDEFNSLVISLESNDFSALFTSDIFGARTTEVIKDLAGRTFDILQVPHHGEYNDTISALIEATAPSYAVIFTSTNNPADVRVTKLLSDKNITTYLSKEGSVEVKYKDGELSVKQ